MCLVLLYMLTDTTAAHTPYVQTEENDSHTIDYCGICFFKSLIYGVMFVCSNSFFVQTLVAD